MKDINSPGLNENGKQEQLQIMNKLKKLKRRRNKLK